MMGVDNIWIQRTVKLADKQYLTVTSPKSNPNISLLYLRLPDGNLRGEGFKASKYKSLSKLYNGAINSIGSTYGNSEFSRNDLITALSEIMTVYKPNEIRTQSSYTEPRSSDHSDHMAVSRFSDRAYEMYKAKLSTPPASLVHYLGYTVHNRPENVFNQDLNDKAAAFFSYANHDNGVCRELTLCDTTTVYGNYIRRQYLEP